VKGSIALRGWHGTINRIFQERSRVQSAFRSRADQDLAVPTKAGAPYTGHLQRRMLVVDSMTPDPTRDSGSMRLTQMLDLLHQDGWSIDFFADDGYASAEDARRLAGIGVTVHQGSLLRWLRDEGADLDAILLCRQPVACQYLGLARKLAPSATVVFDTVDLHYLREQRAAELADSNRLRRHAAQSRKHELEAISRSDVTFVVSPEEQATLARELPGARIELLSNIHEIHGRREGFEARRDLLFIGGFGHPPNADAVRWFATEILPILRSEEPDLALHVVGDIDEPSRLTLARNGIHIHGRVKDLAALMDSCRISVAPLRFGAGVKGKVNLSMSYGMPVVVTSVAAEGMHLENGVNALIADDAAGFAAAILRLYRDGDLWQRLSDAALDNVRDHFSVDHARQTLRQVFAHAIDRAGT
jgi:hypothetical protein